MDLFFNTTISTPPADTILSSQTRFCLLLMFTIPSFACCLVLLYYLCFDQTIRKQLHNHALIFILFNVLLAETIDIPNYLTFLQLNYVWPQIPINCYAWWYITYGCFPMMGVCMAWATIERHILIFHRQWLSTKRKRLFVHYIPLAVVILYGYFFYAACVFLAPCEPVFDYSSAWCQVPCYYGLDPIGRLDAIVNGVLPCFLIIIVNVYLIVRVIRQKQRLRQVIEWHKHKRMIIQIASCSFLFLLSQAPSMSLVLAQKYGLPYGSTGQFEVIVFFLGYFVALLMPFVCLASSKDIWTKIRAVCRPKHRRRRIVPLTIRPGE